MLQHAKSNASALTRRIANCFEQNFSAASEMEKLSIAKLIVFGFINGRLTTSQLLEGSQQDVDCRYLLAEQLISTQKIERFLQEDASLIVRNWNIITRYCNVEDQDTRQIKNYLSQLTTSTKRKVVSPEMMEYH